MAETASPKGLILDLITPISEDGSVDRAGLERHLDRVLPCVHGLLLCGPDAGGGESLGQAQRAALLDAVMDRCGEDMPLMVWITGRTTDETSGMIEVLEAAAEKRSYGGALLWVDTPLLYHSNRGLPQHYRDLLPISSRPIFLFNDPERVKRAARPLKRSNIRTEILKEIAHLEPVQGLVFRGAMDRARNYRKAVRFRKAFRMIDGDEAQFLSHPSRSGVLSAGANLAPRDWQRVTESSMDATSDQKSYPGHLSQVWESGRYLDALRALYGDHPAGRIQAVLARMGVLGAGDSKKSGSSGDDEAAARILSLMEERGWNAE